MELPINACDASLDKRHAIHITRSIIHMVMLGDIRSLIHASYLIIYDHDDADLDDDVISYVLFIKFINIYLLS